MTKLLEAFYSAFTAMEGLKILVHGGGQRASKLSKDLGITPQMVMAGALRTPKAWKLSPWFMPDGPTRLW